MCGLKFIYKVVLRPNTLTYGVELGPIRAMAQNSEKTHVIDQVTHKPESVKCICSHFTLKGEQFSDVGTHM